DEDGRGRNRQGDQGQRRVRQDLREVVRRRSQVIIAEGAAARGTQTAGGRSFGFPRFSLTHTAFGGHHCHRVKRTPPMSSPHATGDGGRTGTGIPVASATPKAKMSKRQKAKISRGIQYGVLIVIAAVIAVVADWPTLIDTFGRVDIAADMFPDVITKALKNTVVFTGLGFILGLVIAIVLALMRLSSVGVYRWIAFVYIEFFRGLPALVVFLVMGFGLPVAFPGFILPQLVVIMIALALVSSAYMAETIRAGIQAVPKGQVEAARSLGMSSSRAMFTIVLPQAMRIILPP